MRSYPAFLLALAFGVATAADGRAASSESAPAAAAVGPELFQGFVVAASATDLYAPEFIFRVLGWHSDWGSRKLLELAPDGKAVKKGDVLARFEFGSEDALRHVNERIQRAQSDEDQSRIDASQAVEALEMEHRRKQIDAKLATLNLERERALSRRQADGLRISHKVAEFDVGAAEPSALARNSPLLLSRSGPPREARFVIDAAVHRHGRAHRRSRCDHRAAWCVHRPEPPPEARSPIARSVFLVEPECGSRARSAEARRGHP